MTDTMPSGAPTEVPPDDGPKRSGSFIVRVIVIVVAALVIAAVVFGVSRAAFSDSTSARGSVATGSVVLDNNVEATTLFAVSNLTGGESFTACVHVTYDGSVTPAPILLYASDDDASGGLGQYLDLKVETGSGKTDVAGDTSCADFVPDATIVGDPTAPTFKQFTDDHGSFSEGLDTGWAAATKGEAKDFRFTFTVQDTNDAQSKSSQPVFTWETQPEA
jgi:hypothetical protein